MANRAGEEQVRQDRARQDAELERTRMYLQRVRPRLLLASPIC
jgi:hypothetical protein